MKDQVVTFRMESDAYSRLALMSVSMNYPRKPGTLIRDILHAWLPDIRCPMPVDPVDLRKIIQEASKIHGRPLRHISMDELFASLPDTLP